MEGVVLYQEKEITTQVSNNLILEDIRDSEINNELKMVIVASRCFPKIKQRKNELFPDGTIIDKINVSGQEVRQFEIKAHINKAILDSGYGVNLSKKERVLLISSILTDVMMSFPYLTTQEVGIAFKKGCREEYGEYKGVSVRVFYKWLKLYTQETKIDANRELIKLDVPKPKILTEEDIKETQDKWLNGVYIAFDEYVEKGELKFYDTNNMLHDYLRDLGVLIILGTRKEIFSEAEQIIRIQHDPLSGKNSVQRNDFLKVIDALNNKDESVKDKIISEAKHITLRRYLSDLRTNNKSLKTIVTEKTRQS